MKEVFLNIRSAIQGSSFTLPNDLSTGKPIVLDANGCVFRWNNQLSDAREGKRPEFPQVCFFVEFVNPVIYKQFGNGVQQAELRIRIYSVHFFFMAQDGYDTQGDQDLTIFDLSEWLYLSLQKYQPTNTGELVRISEEYDYNHDDMTYCKTEFICKYIDYSRTEPVGGSTITAPTTPILPTITN